MKCLHSEIQFIEDFAGSILQSEEYSHFHSQMKVYSYIYILYRLHTTTIGSQFTYSISVLTKKQIIRKLGSLQPIKRLLRKHKSW